VHDAVVRRFLDGKETIPKGMKLAGRWHASGQGWALVESDDLLTVYRFLRQWEDMIRFVVTPVMDDAETAAVLK
jgi:hypothetical protein